MTQTMSGEPPFDKINRFHAHWIPIFTKHRRRFFSSRLMVQEGRVQWRRYYCERGKIHMSICAENDDEMVWNTERLFLTL